MKRMKWFLAFWIVLSESLWAKGPAVNLYPFENPKPFPIPAVDADGRFEVPHLVGRHIGETVHTENALHGFYLLIKAHRKHPSIVGTILEQDPPVGTFVKSKDGIIKVIISSGKDGKGPDIESLRRKPKNND